MLISKNEDWFFGDIKEALTKKEWKKISEIMLKKGVFEGIFTVGKKEISIFRALWSDGIYNDIYKINSGYVGCIKLNDISKKIDLKYLQSIGVFKKIESSFLPINNEGIIIFDDIFIDTRGIPEQCSFCASFAYPYDRDNMGNCSQCKNNFGEGLNKKKVIKKLAHFYLSTNPKDSFKVIANQTYCKLYEHVSIDTEFKKICNNWSKAGWF